MTNNEKYKTAAEREQAFITFCANRECVDCPIYYERRKLRVSRCILTWLDCKAEEENENDKQ